MLCTRLLSVWCGSAASVEEVVGFACSAAGFGAAGEVAKRKPLVLLQGGVTKIFSAEEKQRVEQHDGGIGAQLFTLPQVRFSNTRWDNTTLRKKETVLIGRSLRLYHQFLQHLKNNDFFGWNYINTDVPVNVGYVSTYTDKCVKYMFNREHVQYLWVTDRHKCRKSLWQPLYTWTLITSQL